MSEPLAEIRSVRAVSGVRSSINGEDLIAAFKQAVVGEANAAYSQEHRFIFGYLRKELEGEILRRLDGD